MIRYRVSVRIEIRHEFFDDGRARGLAIEPAPDTAKRLVNLGWLYRAEEGAMALLRPDPDERAGEDEIVLEFRLVATDRAFATFTDLEGWRIDRPYAFDTARALAPQVDGSRPLTRDGNVSLQDLTPDAGNVSSQDLTPDAQDLTPDAPVATGGALAHLVVRVAADDRAVAGGTQSFHLTFGTRRTHWKYLVLGAPAGATPAIRDADGRIEFEPSGVAQVPDGRQAVTLRSTEPIALRERATQRFQLRAQSSAGERVLVKRLAVASPRNLGRDTVDGREVAVSEIYINL